MNSMNAALKSRAAIALAGFFNNGGVQVRNAAGQVLVTIQLAANAFQGSAWINSRQGTIGTAANADQAPADIKFIDNDDTGEFIVSIGQATTAWAAGQTVSDSDVRTHNGANYVCILGHTTASNYEPGVGANWRDRWRLQDGMIGPATLDAGKTFSVASFDFSTFVY